MKGALGILSDLKEGQELSGLAWGRCSLLPSWAPSTWGETLNLLCERDVTSA